MILAACLALLAACGPTRTTEGFDQRIAPWIGQTEAALVSGFGVPSRTYEADGRRLLQYDLWQPAAAPAVYPSIGLGFGNLGWGVGTGLGLGFGGPAPPQGCALVFEVWEGVVRSYQRHGPGCVG